MISRTSSTSASSEARTIIEFSAGCAISATEPAPAPNAAPVLTVRVERVERLDPLFVARAVELVAVRIC